MSNTSNKSQRKRSQALNVGERAVVADRSYTIGRDAFAKISAVEGIALTAEAARRSQEFDRKGLSPEQRRQAVIDAYRPKG